MHGYVSIPLDDPRLCLSYGLGLHRDQASGACNVAFVLFNRQYDECPQREPLAVNLSTPAEAREIALKIFEMAEAADREMNAALQPKEGR